MIYQYSCILTPKQNGVVELTHHRLLNVAHALHFQANLSLKFWDDCILTTAYLINRTSIKVVQDKTPHESLFKKILFYHYLKVFGCLCYEHNLNIENKFDAHVSLGIFVKYLFVQKEIGRASCRERVCLYV